MNCPRCGNEMMEVVKHTITIDTCPSCGGLWLDKGELAKITAQIREAEASLDRELAGGKEYVRPPAPPSDRYRQPDSRYEREHGYHHQEQYKHHKKKMRFKDLFDIFD